ncbi:glyoxalase/bleomycin resistance/extradiol dioxygenase family protein [Pedobacter petrophilus]|uniref:Glyoxalase/bleomycin resistance/extradiol dioxygenase family protein n=2 Tax=Pedobacter TaxID=84567 RepID=A0A7K0FS63_9SPHI|nr:VOC family protein [Pedobacter petrophilus]MRX74457.1 glyoxalase/bleomycin resistance/extradiol dioxygenase family protein [Pedobacter petrophilus]
MQTSMIWGNLAVEDLKRTKSFYEQLGFKSNGYDEVENLASFKFGDNQFVINFFKSDRLASSMNGNVNSTRDGNEVIFSMAAKSNEEVDQWAELVKSSRGTLNMGPKIDENGFYVCVFSDPDGHKFNIVCMDERM